MAKPQIEELRKRAWVLYDGSKGVDLVKKEVKKMGVKEDHLNDVQLKLVLNNIIKNVFIDYVGYDKTKELLAKEITHVPGYHTIIEKDTKKIHIFERINLMKWLGVFIVFLMLSIIVLVVYYSMSFDTLKLCHNKKDDQSKDLCFLPLALNTLNISLCDELSTRIKAYNCYSAIGVKLNDTNICNSIPADDVDLLAAHDQCIMCVAYKLDNRSLCNSFMNPIKEAECIHSIERGRSLSC